MDECLLKYRDHLVCADQKSQEDFDKTLITLASSSLGVSLVFVRDFVGGDIVAPVAIIAGWLCLTASLGTVLLGFYLSRFALRKAIRQIDAGVIHAQKPGGMAAIFVEVLNAVSGLFLLIGIVLITYFAFENLKSQPQAEKNHVDSTTTKQ